MPSAPSQAKPASHSKSVIVGTAGHIDHGKTALVKALTGIDADRLQEEKRRGITIDIGFAHLKLASASGETFRLGFVDVPGHERFVRNMLAGIGGIDLVLLVIAADEGIKPQTREHFDICRLLSVRRGITVLTKSDMVDGDTLGVVRMEVEEFLRGSFLDVTRAPMVAVSAKTGAGLDDLKRELAAAALEVPAKDSAALFRLPIDRVFVMKGFGSVVTGTLVAGSVGKEDEVEIFPLRRGLRVRGVQVHGITTDRAVAGERTALNLAAISKDEIARGMTVAVPGKLQTSKRIDVQLNLLRDARPLRERARVHFHAYTAETIAEVLLHKNADGSAKKQLEPGSSAFVRLRVKEPMLLLPGDRFIVRQFSPVVTIGGGVVLDVMAPARKSDAKAQHQFLQTMLEGSAEEQLTARISRRAQSGLKLAEAVAESGWPEERVLSNAAGLLTSKIFVRIVDTFISADAFSSSMEALTKAVNDFHKANPLVAGVSKEELREKLKIRPEIFSAALERLVAAKRIVVAGEQVHAAGRGVVMKDEEAEAKKTIESAFALAGLKVPALKEVIAGLPVDKTRAQKIVTLLLRDRVLVKLSDDLVFHQEALASLRKMLAGHKASGQKTIDVGKFKDMTGVTRKYAIPLLEFLDRERITRRDGDVRVIL